MTWRTITVAVWIAIGASLAVYWVFTRVRLRHAGADALLRAWAANPYRRVALLLAWMWLGWHAFAR